MITGIVAALLAALVWSLNFVVPFVIGEYSVFDFAAFRFLISGAVGLAVLLFGSPTRAGISARDCVLAFWLGLIGYLLYFLSVAGAAIFAGPMIAPAFLGLVPVVLGVAGNLRQRSASWRALSVPLGLAALGLVLVNAASIEVSSVTASHSMLVGIPLAITAVALWTWFAMLNQRALAERPSMNGRVWTSLIMVGAAVGMVAFIPIGLALGVFEIPRLGLHWTAAAPLIVWGTTLALVGSVGGALAWTYAAQRLPIALSAQLVTMETVFGAVLGLLIHRRWPTIVECTGMTLLVVGVLSAIRVFHGRTDPVVLPELSPSRLGRDLTANGLDYKSIRASGDRQKST